MDLRKHLAKMNGNALTQLLVVGIMMWFLQASEASEKQDAQEKPEDGLASLVEICRATQDEEAKPVPADVLRFLAELNTSSIGEVLEKGISTERGMEPLGKHYILKLSSQKIKERNQNQAVKDIPSKYVSFCITNRDVLRAYGVTVNKFQREYEKLFRGKSSMTSYELMMASVVTKSGEKIPYTTFGYFFLKEWSAPPRR